jgi:O-methyltransferase
MGALIRILRQIIYSVVLRVFSVNDVVRYETLRLIVSEVYQKGIFGAVAELGVYKGEFAKHINKYFHDRKLFLFDTFAGFDERDVKTESKNGYLSAAVTKAGDFCNQSVELVLQKMKYRHNCVIKKGWFPETAAGVEEKFAFVSIDTDLFEPIYQGLLFFYPRLSRGGYIFIHDYNGELYGAKDAVRKFCAENNVAYVPLNDNCGSAIIAKA